MQSTWRTHTRRRRCPLFLLVAGELEEYYDDDGCEGEWERGASLFGRLQEVEKPSFSGPSAALTAATFSRRRWFCRRRYQGQGRGRHRGRRRRRALGLGRRGGWGGWGGVERGEGAAVVAHGDGRRRIVEVFVLRIRGFAHAPAVAGRHVLAGRRAGVRTREAWCCTRRSFFRCHAGSTCLYKKVVGVRTTKVFTRTRKSDFREEKGFLYEAVVLPFLYEKGV